MDNCWLLLTFEILSKHQTDRFYCVFWLILSFVQLHKLPVDVIFIVFSQQTHIMDLDLFHIQVCMYEFKHWLKEYVLMVHTISRCVHFHEMKYHCGTSLTCLDMYHSTFTSRRSVPLILLHEHCMTISVLLTLTGLNWWCQNVMLVCWYPEPQYEKDLEGRCWVD